MKHLKGTSDLDLDLCPSVPPNPTYPSLGQDRLLSAERAGDGEALRGQVHREAVEAEGVQAGEHLKWMKKTHETHLSLTTSTCAFRETV